AGVVSISQQLIDRFAVAVRCEKIPKRIKRKAKRVHLSMRVMLDAGTIEPQAIGVPRTHVHHVAVAALYVRIVVVTMSAIQPPVETAPKTCLIPMCVPRRVEVRIEHLSLVRLSVTICVLEMPNVRDGPHYSFPSLLAAGV